RASRLPAASGADATRRGAVAMTVSTTLAAFVHRLTLDDIPSAAREHAKLLILDTLGIALAGIEEPASRAARAVARLAGGAEHATLFVHGDRVPVAVPAALAVGEYTNASGADVLTAVVAGYEVMTRVGNAINAGSARMAHHR